MITYCDINTCKECPRYGDDCDGDKRVEHTDLISRADAIEAVHKYFVEAFNNEPHEIDEDGDDVFTDMKSVNALLHHNKYVSKALKALPSSDAEWIPCSERLPEDIKPVIVTWKNNDPKSYYQYIVGKHFIGTAHYLNGKWFWYSSTTEDLLAEYGRCDGEEFDEAIEVVAWMPLPKPYREDGEA